MPPPSTLQTTQSGLDPDLVPYHLWTKAKKLGTWDPSSIDFSQDPADWGALTDREQDLLLRLTAQFEGGEESVTRHLLPLLQRIATEGRLEEEMFLTSYLWEEAKHVDGFDHFLRHVAESSGNLERYFTEPYRQLMFEELPGALNRLHSDPSPEALASASVTYQMVVEGILAETGYTAYHTILRERNILPGMQAFVERVQQDESRHVAYGVFLLSRLVAKHGDDIWTVIETRMNELLPLVLTHIQETLAVYDEPIPFGVSVDQFLDIGSTQFQKRLQHLERARSQSLEEVLYGKQTSAAEPSGDTRPARPPGWSPDDGA